jgi:hypothetical protein
MKGPFGMLLIGGSIILLIGLFTGKIVFPGGQVVDPIAAKTNTLAQNISLGIFGQSQVSAAQQAANRATEPSQNVGVLPKNGNCPPGTSYLPWDGKCYKIAGI